MPNKTIFALGANVALDKANDIFHLWQPAASGEKDRKATIQTIIDLLDVNTSFSNVPYLDKANTFTAQNIFTGIVTVGEVNPGASHPLEVYSSTVDIAARIQTALANGIAGLILENDAQSWEPRVAANDNFVLRDITSSLSPVQVEPGAPTNSDYTDATGRKGWGRAPTSDFDMYRASKNVELLLKTDFANGFATLSLVNDAQRWELSTTSDDTFKFRDITNSKNPLIVEPNSPTNSIYVATTGVGINENTPVRTLHVNSGIVNITALFESTDVTSQIAFIDDTTTGPTYVSIGSTGDDLVFGAGNSTRATLTSVGAFLRATTTSLHSTIPTIESVGDWALIGRDASGDDAIKQTRIGLTHFDIDEEPLVLLNGFMNAGSSIVNVGGGTVAGNTATLISFFTAADTVTITGIEAGRITNAQNWIINGVTDVPGARLQIAGTDAAFLLSRLTTGERDALTPVNGMIIYNTTTGVLEARESGAWVDL